MRERNDPDASNLVGRLLYSLPFAIGRRMPSRQAAESAICLATWRLRVSEPRWRRRTFRYFCNHSNSFCMRSTSQ
jgi:hypothetical protein